MALPLLYEIANSIVFRLLVPDQTIKSWIGRYKRKYGLYGRREPLKEITEGKAKFHLLPPLPPITKKQNEKRIKNPASRSCFGQNLSSFLVQFSLMYGGVERLLPPGVGAPKMHPPEHLCKSV